MPGQYTNDSDITDAVHVDHLPVRLHYYCSLRLGLYQLTRTLFS